jgi:signal transduction histidine kinase
MRSLFKVVPALLACLLTGVPASALDPERTIAQYKHTQWTIDDGAPRNVQAIAQGPDGYLWIGSGSGLYRFDGLSFQPIRPAASADSKPITSLLVSREGDVWVGYGTGGGTSVYRNGVLRDVPTPQQTYVMDMVQTPDGSIWAMIGERDHPLMRFKHGRWAEVGASVGFPFEAASKMIVARDGTIWITTVKSLLFLRPGATHLERTRVAVFGRAAPSEDAQGNIWLSDDSGSRVVIRNGSDASARPAIPYPTLPAKRKTATVFDRNGNLWGLTRDGLFRLASPVPQGAPTNVAAALAVARFNQKDGLLADSVTALFEDREGNLWIGTPVGLERFRSARVVAEPSLTKVAFWGDALLGASDGTVYIGEADGVYGIKPGGKPEMLLHADEPQAICEGIDHAIWIVLKDRVLRMRDRRIVNTLPAPKSDYGALACEEDRNGHLWLATVNNGMFGRIGDAWHQILVPIPPANLAPQALLRIANGDMLIGSEATGLAKLVSDNEAKFLIPYDNPFGKVRTLFDSKDGLLFGGPSGLGRIKGQTVQILSPKRFPSLGYISGISQSGGQTWVYSRAGLVGMSTAALNRAFDDQHSGLTPTILDFRDGLMGVASRDTPRSVVKGGDGRLWFSTGAGIVWIDPARLGRNRVVPPTAIGRLIAQGVTYLDPKKVRLSAGTTSIEIGFAALSLSIPERVQVRYQLEGADRGWVDPGQRRQAFYTNLGPGHYRFRVIAANDDGLWNRTGTTMEFDIPPTFLQSNIFLALCGLVAGALLWGAYLLRVRQIKAVMRSKLEERLAERERIARDLHDTLLQGFQGLVMRFQSVANAIPEGQQTRAMIDQALDSADEVLSDGRDSVRQLRAAGTSELSQELTVTAQRLQQDYPVEFSMAVEGTPRALHPVVRDEVCRIGDEALINAFQHAKATMIEVVISYRPSVLVLGVRDNGIGIDPEIFERGGRQGHFGLAGMRERAQQVHAEFDVSSRPGSGTEIQLRVPGRLAYADRPRWRLVDTMKRYFGWGA